MRHITNSLEKLGLSAIESKLYVMLLESGPIGVRELSEWANIKRTTAYVYIDQLIEKGLVIKIIKGSRRQVEANNPEKSIQLLIDKKVEDAKTAQEQFPQIVQYINTELPILNDINEEKINYYKGKRGVKKIYEEVLKTKELRSFVNIEEIAEIFPENFELFDNSFTHNPHINMLEIVENSTRAKKRIAMSHKIQRYHYKFLPEGMKLSAQDILIYDGKVAIIHFKNRISGVVLSNTDLYKNFKLLFDYIWKTLPDEKG